MGEVTCFRRPVAQPGVAGPTWGGSRLGRFHAATRCHVCPKWRTSERGLVRLWAVSVLLSRGQHVLGCAG